MVSKSQNDNDPMLKDTIKYWDVILSNDRFLLSPSVIVFIEHTIKYLKELRVIKEGKND